MPDVNELLAILSQLNAQSASTNQPTYSQGGGLGDLLSQYKGLASSGQEKKKNNLWGDVGKMGGAAIGGYFGGPQGAGAGARVGGQLGSNFGGMF